MYRTVPEIKFKFKSKCKRTSAMNFKSPHFQRRLSTLPDEKVLIKTMNNILLKDYDEKHNSKLNGKSILLFE